VPSPQFFVVGSGERLSLINSGERPDWLQRQGSNPWATTKGFYCGENWYSSGSHKPASVGSIPTSATTSMPLKLIW